MPLNIRDRLRNYVRTGVFGTRIRIEACSICQLRCVECPQSKGQMQVIGHGYLKFTDFRAFVDRYPTFTDVELSNYGEILLNPELDDIVEYAHRKGITLTASNGVNLNHIREDTIEHLVKHEFKRLNVSIDGASNETYAIYRRGGVYDRVIENIRKINECKRRHNSRFPELSWQFIVFGHDEHEIPIARKMAEALGMKFHLRLNVVSPGYSPIRDAEYVRREVGAASVQEWNEQNNDFYDLCCQQLWVSPQINWDGRLLGCCCNKWGDFGNVFESDLKECVEAEKYAYTKRMLLGYEEDRKDIPCVRCKYRIRDKGLMGRGILRKLRYLETGLTVARRLPGLCILSWGGQGSSRAR